MPIVSKNNLNPLPKISIIVALKNRESTIKRCLDSLFQQDYENLEVIIIDGGSTDQSLSIIKENYLNKNYTLSSENDSGIYSAFNKGIQKSTGDWILFIGSDDFLLHSRVFTIVAPILAQIQNKTRIAYAQTMMFQPSHSLIQSELKWESYPRGEPWNKIKSFSTDRMVIPHTSTFHHKDLFKKIGLFNESFKIAGDFELLIRALKYFEPFFIQELISAASLGGVSSEKKNTSILLKEMQLARKLNGIFPYRFLEIKTSLKQFIKKLLPLSS